MPLFRADASSQQLTQERPVPFAQQQWQERRDLQPLLRENPSAIDSNLMIVSEEFGEWEESARRIDLLGLDGEGNLVVIELKRTDEGGHMELQAIRYAAMVSSMDFEGVVRAYQAFLAKRGGDAENARQKLLEFLGANDVDDGQPPSISRTPRIVLVAPSFSREMTTAVLWLNEQGLTTATTSGGITTERCIR